MPPRASRYLRILVVGPPEAALPRLVGRHAAVPLHLVLADGPAEALPEFPTWLYELEPKEAQ